MKKLLVMGLIIFSLFALVACGHNGGTQDTVETPGTQNEIPPTNPTTSALDFPVRTIEELGGTISVAGAFWEDWWNLKGPFAWEHLESLDWDEVPEHLKARTTAWNRLLPSSGFESLDDIRNYLLRYYTESWVDAEMACEWFAFAWYDGALYVDGTRAGFPRPDWGTAVHTLIEQEGGHAVVETVVYWGSWHRYPHEDVYSWEVPYIFTFIDGRIDTVDATPFQ